MFLTSHNKSECCGCTACESICPKNVIRMTEDQDGFAFPEIANTDECISCGQCERVCPMINFQKAESAPSCYFGWVKDNELYERSTSGGAFSAFCQWGKDRGYSEVYGAGYSDDGRIVHKSVAIEKFQELIGTKYVQSYLGETFREVRSKLLSGKRIIFVGTPCQVEGLLRYVGKRGIENLFTISLICHNTASPKAYKKYLQEASNNALLIRFRDKKYIQDGVSATTIVHKDGKEFGSIQNPYTTAFGLGLMSRHSCNVCPFTTVYRNSDITIGDFWGLDRAMPELAERCSKGVSLILAHSDQGKSALKEMEEYMECSEVDVDLAINDKQPQLSAPAPRNPRRDGFMRAILVENKSFVKTANHEINRWKIRNRIKRYLHI